MTTYNCDTEARDAQRAFNARLHQLREENAQRAREAQHANIAEYQAAARAGLIEYADPVALQPHQKLNWTALFLTIVLSFLPYFGPTETRTLSHSPVVTVTPSRDHYRSVITRAALPVSASIYTA
jgi:hypothetical protein